MRWVLWRLSTRELSSETNALSCDGSSILLRSIHLCLVRLKRRVHDLADRRQGPCGRPSRCPQLVGAHGARFGHRPLAKQVGHGAAEILRKQLHLSDGRGLPSFDVCQKARTNAAIAAAFVGLTPFLEQYCSIFCTRSSLSIGFLSFICNW